MLQSSRAGKNLSVDCGVWKAVGIPWAMTRNEIWAEMQITVSLDMKRAEDRRRGRDGGVKCLEGT